MTAAAVISLSHWSFSPRCFVPIDTTVRIEDRLLPPVLCLFALHVCLRCAPFSLLLIYAGKPGYCRRPGS